MMVRTVYVWLLRLHPAPFRRRFAEEMLEIFDQSPERAWTWLLDGVFSLIRQWAFRNEVPEPAIAGGVPGDPRHTPTFRTLDDDKPRPFALIDGAILSVAFFAFFVFAMNYGAIRRPLFFIGVHHASPHLIPVERSSLAETSLTTTIAIPEREDPLRAIASTYFKIIRVLGVLDANEDFVISPWEIITAPAALRKLDTDHNGKLTPEECGFSLNAGPEANFDPEFVSRAHLAFMRANPVLAALDTDRDGEISAAEIETSSAALKSLDRNHDGELTPNELIPDAAQLQATMIFSRLDTNGDGTISSLERTTRSAAPFDALLEAAGKNHDGTVTQQELTDYIRIHLEHAKQLQRAKDASGFGLTKPGPPRSR